MINKTNVRDQILGLNDNDKLVFTYRDTDYEIVLHKFTSGDSYSIAKWGEFMGRSMNIKTIGSKFITMYSYDLMNTRTTYKMAYDEMNVLSVVPAA